MSSSNIPDFPYDFLSYHAMYVSCGRFFLLDSSCRIFGTGLLHGLPRGRGKTVATTPLGVGFLEENREIEATLPLLLSLFTSVCYSLCPFRNKAKKAVAIGSLLFLFFFPPQTLDTSFSTKVDATNDSLLKAFLPRHFTFQINRLENLGGIQELEW